MPRAMVRVSNLQKVGNPVWPENFIQFVSYFLLLLPLQFSII